MRLTLRTLLAWMDDTLPAAEVKEIGRQVKESPFATKLVEKIRQVTRRRRLGVPSSSGSDATDPNLVAAYLDNELDAEQVEKYEKLCLTSDVHLAEVASVHQILSMVRHKAKVPSEARYRMYRLIGGREAVRKLTRGSRTEPAASMSRGEPPWAPSRRRPVSLWARFGPPAAVASLIGLLLWAGWLNLRGPAPSLITGSDSDRLANVEKAQGGPVVEAEEGMIPGPQATPAGGLKQGLPDAVADPERGGAPEAAVGMPKGVLEAGELEAVPVAPQPDREAEKAVPAGVVADGVVGTIEESDNLVLRHNDAERTWERLAAKAELRAGDRLVHLAPLRATLRIGGARFRLVGESEVIVRASVEPYTASIDLIRGRLVVEGVDSGASAGAAGQGSNKSTSVIVGFEGHELGLEVESGRLVGLEARGQRPPGEASGSMILAVYVPEGQVVLTPDPREKSETMQGPALRFLDRNRNLSQVQAQVPPRWVTEKAPSAVEQRAGEAFLGLFGDGTTEFSLLEGVSDPRPEVQGLSVAALGATGNEELVMPLLSRPNAPTLRQAVFSVLQGRLAERPDALEKLEPLLQQYSESPEIAEELKWLLVGFTLEQQRQRSTFERLVRDLKSPNPSVRELAIFHLQHVTRRDAGGYDPDKPESGVRFWESLLRDGKIGPPAKTESQPEEPPARTPSRTGP